MRNQSGRVERRRPERRWCDRAYRSGVALFLALGCATPRAGIPPPELCEPIGPVIVAPADCPEEKVVIRKVARPGCVLPPRPERPAAIADGGLLVAGVYIRQLEDWASDAVERCK
jgi:hypothetical protein